MTKEIGRRAWHEDGVCWQRDSVAGTSLPSPPPSLCAAQMSLCEANSDIRCRAAFPPLHGRRWRRSTERVAPRHSAARRVVAAHELVDASTSCAVDFASEDTIAVEFAGLEQCEA